ncbi:MAG: DUF4445 domain-containing protein [Clostridia bacterium]|nr:DUF4445 domain-containing protein [Clostridia bacterium]
MFFAVVNETCQISFSEATLLSELLYRAGEYITMPCGGKGICGNCKVIAKGELSPLSEKEKEVLTPDELKQGFRLACQAKATGDVSITAKVVPMAIAVDCSIESDSLSYDRTDGLVIDIGTTTIAAILYQDKKPVKIITEENCQRGCGADVISRITFEKDHPGMASRLLGGQITEILSVCGNPKNTVIVANTAMLHFLTEQSVLPLGEAPYSAHDLFGKEYVISNTPCYLPPCVSAFVGADITAGILASQMAEKPETSMLVDFGTNGELAYFDGKSLYTASTAAGPAFEGADIFHGMPAQPGAVDHVWIENGNIRYTTIGNTIARGICGSGLVDLLAVMLECGALEESGSLNPHHPLCKKDHHGKICFALPESNVILRASDIRKLQLAKGAIHAGMITLAEKVDTLYIAGGFGSYLNPENAQKIGLLPKDFAKEIKVLGNTALCGGGMLLFSDEMRQKVAEIAQSCQSVAFHQNPTFTEHYIDKMQFEA